MQLKYLPGKILRSLAKTFPQQPVIVPLIEQKNPDGTVQQISYSPHLHFETSNNLAEHYVREHARKHPNGILLDVGGGRGSLFREWAAPMTYRALDIEPQYHDDFVIEGDICNCPQIADESFDVIFSHNTYEHVAEPWKAAAETGRILKKGGITVCLTVFSWRYHPVPGDYWRFTHTALKHIFETYGGLETLATGYDISKRRDNTIGRLPDGSDLAPVDEMGGWRENWKVYYVGKKPE